MLTYDEGKGAWIGGMFWDGRATGSVLEDPLAEQAMGPFLNPLEMNMPDPNLFPPPDYAGDLETLNFTMMPGQAMMDQANLLAFLKTLSDGYEAS